MFSEMILLGRLLKSVMFPHHFV